MHIGIVTTWFERGAAYVSKQYYDSLSQNNDVYIYARGEKYATDDPVWDQDYVTWGKRSHLPPVIKSLDLADFKKWILNNNIQIVIFNEQTWWEPVLLCNEMGIITGAYIDYYTQDTVPFFACYDFLLCNTKRHQDVFKWHPNCIFIPWGTDTDVFKPKCFKPVKDGWITFFHNAGWSPYRKGTDLLLKAFLDVKGNARLVIHSQGKIADILPDLGDQIDKLTESGRLICYEESVTAPGLYHLGDVYVYPSRLDGIGLSVAEALSCGLPIITSDNPPMNEFVCSENGKLAKVNQYISRSDGYYWPEGPVNITDLTRCMQYYVDHYSHIEEYKQSARKTAECSLNWKKNSQGVSGSIQSINLPNNNIPEELMNKIRKYELQKYNPIYRVWKNHHYLYIMICEMMQIKKMIS